MEFCLSLHCNGSNSVLCVDGIKIYKFKAKNSEIKLYLSCLGKILKYFRVENMKKKKKGLNAYVYDFSVDYNTINVMVLWIFTNIQ